jgi:hypothetical protein
MRSPTVLGRTALAIALLLFTAFAVMAADDAGKDDDKKPDVIFIPTPLEVVDKMLELARVTRDDVLYDLGCGDGRIVCTAARKYRCKACGFDIDPDRIKDSEAGKAKLDKEIQKLVTFERKNIFAVDLSKATVVTLYLEEYLNVKLIPQLQKMKEGSRIVSHEFHMSGVKEEKKIVVKTKEGEDRNVYLWKIPLKFEKEKK